MSRFIKHLEAIGIHGRFDIDLTFQDGVNIIHGSNGTGKTTLLHILANAVNEDFRRFGYLKFQKLTITLNDDTKILIKQDSSGDPLETFTKIWINDQEIADYSFHDLIEQENKEENSGISMTGYYYSSSSKKKEKQDIDLKATYFPAFRTMIEAWATLDENEIRHFARRSPNFRRVLRSSAKSTELARILFGKFVPRLEYPSPIEIEEHINSELTEAQLKIASLDRSLLSQAFIQFSQAISQSFDFNNNIEPEEVITQITELSEKLQNSPFQMSRDNSDDVYQKLIERLNSFQSEPEYKTIAARVLSVYKSSLQKRLDAQTKAYSSIETYLKSVNEFLERKQLRIGSNGLPPRRSRLGVKIGDEEAIHSLQILSSGERQVVGLIYAASHLTGGGKVVLIDEPEISLHIDWQRKLLPEMVKQLGEKQLIICTHSSVIASKYRDRMIKLELKPTANANINLENSDFLEDQDAIYMIDDDLENILF